jgi:hypothetical protein
MHEHALEMVRVGGSGGSGNGHRQGYRHLGPAEHGLESGHYLVLRSRRRSGAPVWRFFGPLASEVQAKFLAVSAQALGLSEAGALPPKAASAPPARGRDGRAARSGRWPRPEAPEFDFSA